MNRALNVLILDDSPTTALGSLNQFLGAARGDADRFILHSLTDPARLDGHLRQHPQLDAVLVDVGYELTSTATCLTAFRTLINRKGPMAIGLSQPHYGRTLFPFGVCQLLPPPEAQIIVGWAYKDDKDNRGFPEVIRILDKIASGQPLTKPRSLERCMPDAARHTGEFMQRILKSRLDVKLWDMLSTTHYQAKDLALTASVEVHTVRRRFDEYLDAIVDFEAAMADDDYHPVGTQAALMLPTRQLATADAVPEPRQRAIEAFAQAHRLFFQAPELEDIVVEYDLRKSRQRSLRRRRRVESPWWKPHRPS